MSQPRPAASTEDVPGLPARRVAANAIDNVIRRSRPLDEQFEGAQAQSGFLLLADRDRALARNIAATALRRLGTLRALVGELLERGVPRDAPQVEAALIAGAAQILFLDVPNHAAVDLSVRLVQGNRRAARYAGLVNAVLRRIAQTGAARLAALDTIALDTPGWLMARWSQHYGAETARAIAAADGSEPSLDLTPADAAAAAALAQELGGRVLSTGSIRMVAHGPVSLLPGFADGTWWVQDAAAALPARLFGNVQGQHIADICAAPGGKTAQLAAAGAAVVAIDRSERRMARLADNLARLKLRAETVVADALAWRGEALDGVLIDAPCSSTGTIRRHPDIAWLKHESDLAGLVDLQRRLLDHAVGLVKPGGVVVFCTCSLEPEEGDDLIAALLARDPRVQRHPIAAPEIGGEQQLLTAAGDLRTLPCHLPDSDPRMAGLDGFFAARLQRV